MQTERTNRITGRGVVLSKFMADVLAWAAMAPLAFLLRLEAGIVSYLDVLLLYTVGAGAVKATAVYLFGLHLRAWKWVGVRDLSRLLVAVGSVCVVLGGVVALASGLVPRSIPLIEAPLAVLTLSAIRMSRRLRHERTHRRPSSELRPVLIVGAGDAGVLLAREILRHPESALDPVGYLDDDSQKRSHLHAGLPVLGSVSDLERVVAEREVQEVLLALPSAPGRVIRGVVEAAHRAGVVSRTIPRLTDLASGQVHINEFRDVDVEDLLRRAPVHLDTDPIERMVTGRRILVTGAGGSIGSEIVRQIAAFSPASVVLLGRGENSIYQIARESASRWPEMSVHSVICDVRDRTSLRGVFECFSPEAVFHAAAHKHVPLMEANPAQAILNNVVGTKNVAELSAEFGVKRLVNVSTDKAVNPTNVMGASKRVAELVVSSVAAESDCAMVSVRFGNVLGSRGSVVPLFQEQIVQGGPVTVTHPEMVRYFMTIPEAAQLVLQAGAAADSGRVYVLDMGEPVRIADLARDLILLSGLEPGEDIKIEFSGTRPGEKLFEELLLAEEGTEPGPHDKIFTARNASHGAAIEEDVASLIAEAESNSPAGVRAALQRLVPNYRPEAAAETGSGRVDPHGDGATLHAECSVRLISS